MFMYCTVLYLITTNQKSFKSNQGKVKMRRVLVYARVSTPRQRGSLEYQRHQLETFLQRQGVDPVATYSDVGSGRDIEKLPDLRKLRSTIQLGESVLIRDVSRLGRNVGQVEQLVRELTGKHCVVHSINDQVTSKNPEFLHLARSAEYQLQAQQQAQKRTIEWIKEQGGYIGRPPYGYRIDMSSGIPMLASNFQEQRTIQSIVRWYKDGYEVDHIVRLLKGCGNLRRGYEWTNRSIKKVLKKGDV